MEHVYYGSGNNYGGGVFNLCYYEDYQNIKEHYKCGVFYGQGKRMRATRNRRFVV